jgi:hypothetical protein
MRLRHVPKDIAISASFVAVFLLALIPSWLLLWSPDLLLAIKAFRAKTRREAGPEQRRRPPTQAPSEG